jgi:hypothetical protein
MCTAQFTHGYESKNKFLKTQVAFKCIIYKKISPGSGSSSLQLSQMNVNDRVD